MVVNVGVVSTSPHPGQKTGTSGLRKKTSEFMQPHYLANWVQSLFNVLLPHGLCGSTLVLGGDGRFWNDEAIQIILRVGFGNGVSSFVVGQNGVLSTPAVSSIIRERAAFGELSPRSVLPVSLPANARFPLSSSSSRRHHSDGKSQSGRSPQRFRHQI